MMTIDEAKTVMTDTIREMREDGTYPEDDIEAYETVLEAASDLTQDRKMLVVELDGANVGSVRTNFSLPEGVRLVVIDYTCTEGLPRELEVNAAIHRAFAENITEKLY